jgi:hypothetical protein
MKMTVRPFHLSVVLLALAANPCFAKDGHAQRGARAGTANNGASGKGLSGNSARANPAPSKADVPINAEPVVAPPVLPRHGGPQQQTRTINPSLKTVNRGNASRSQAGAMMTAAPTARNAIGQPVVSSNNFTGAQPPVLTVQRLGAGSPQILHGGSVVSPAVSSGTARVSVANGSNRGDLNGATVIRPTTGPPVIGGPAQARYGINGTTVQNKH